MSVTANESPRKLPLWSTVAGAHRALWAERKALLRFAWPWLVLSLATTAVLDWMYFPRSQQTSAEINHVDIAYYAIATLVPMLVSAIVSVFLHRRILISGGDSVPGAQAPMPIVTSYLWRNLLLSAMVCAPFALFALAATFASQELKQMADAEVPQLELSLQAVTQSQPGDDAFAEGQAPLPQTALPEELLPSVGGACMCLAIVAAILLPLIVLFAYLPTRFGLALPATAVGKSRNSFAESWKATRRNFWRLFWGSVLSGWPVYVVLCVALARTLLTAESRVQYAATNSAVALAGLIAGLIWVAFFSLSYRHLIQSSEGNAGVTSTKP